MTKKAPHPRAEHPLFPFPADAADIDLSERDISWIYVARKGAFYPQKFRFDELSDEDQLVEHFGGGSLTLKARNESRSRWTATREITLPGAPKEEAPKAPSMPSVAFPSMETSSPFLRDFLAGAAILGPMVMTYLENSNKRQDAFLALLMQQRQSDPNQSMMPILQALIARNPTMENIQAMQQAVHMGMAMGAKGQEDDTADLIEAFSNGVGQVVELERLKKENAPKKPE